MFEIEFKYYKQKEDLDYNKNEPLIFKNKFGKVDENYPVENLAKYILTQLARRDIFIYDVDIYEYTKKKVNFKLGKNGFSVAGNKFNNSSLAENCDLESNIPDDPQDIPRTDEEKVLSKPTTFQKLANKIDNQFANVDKNKIKRKVIFDPPLRMDKAQFPYKFTKAKIYPVYSEKYNTNGIGMLIVTNDDNNNVLEVTDEYFVPAPTLVFDNEMNASKIGNNDLLNWKGMGGNEAMINLRGK